MADDKSVIARLWAIDRRALVAFRIGLGLILLLDLVMRAGDLRAHYTDLGVLPRQAMLAVGTNQYHFSLHFLSGTVAFQIVLFALAAAFAFTLVIGYRPFLSALISWLLLSSLHARNPLILNGGDTLLRIYLFWALFLPLGRPTPRGKAAPTAGPFLSWGSAAILIQVALVYVCTAALKTHPWWTTEGKAVYYALSIDYLVTPLGHHLLQYPLLLRVLTHTVYALEWAGPLLVFLPWKTEAVRKVLVALFVAMHLGFYLCMELGFFPAVSMLGWLLFLPGSFWDKFGSTPGPATAPGGRRAPSIVDRPMLVRYVHPLTQATAALLLLYIVAWNLRGLYVKSGESVKTRWYDVPGRLLRLDQKWAMFAARPPRESGWYVVAAKLRNGDAADLARSTKGVSWQKPARIARDYPNHRWAKYMTNLANSRFEKYREFYAKYMVRTWNERHPPPERVQSSSVYYLHETTLAEGGKSVPKKTRLYTYRRPGPRKAVPADAVPPLAPATRSTESIRSPAVAQSSPAAGPTGSEP